MIAIKSEEKRNSSQNWESKERNRETFEKNTKSTMKRKLKDGGIQGDMVLFYRHVPRSRPSVRLLFQCLGRVEKQAMNSEVSRP